jgi:hypothetical protein
MTAPSGAAADKSARRPGPLWRSGRLVVAAAAARVRAAARTLGEIIYGATGFEFERHAARTRADLENLFIFMVMGDLLGVPVLPPYYSLRLVPYLIEVVPSWRRRVLRERQPFESEEFDLHGV